jgi:hypothetical protein
MAQVPFWPEDMDRPLQFVPLRSVLWASTILRKVKQEILFMGMGQVKQVEAMVDNKRRIDRVKAVLPVRVSGNSDAGDGYCDLVHTLDVTANGVRLGSVRRPLEVGSQVVLQYRQHRAEFRVIWIRPMASSTELQVGLEADVQRDLWGLDTSSKSRPQAAPAVSSTASIGA